MVFYQKIEQVGALFFEPRVNVLAVECLQDGAERAMEALVLFLPEDRRGTELLTEPPDDALGFFLRNRLHLSLMDRRGGDSLMVVIVEEVEGVGIIRHHPKQGLGLVGSHLMAV